MDNRNITNGLAALVAGLLTSSLSSFLERFTVLGSANEVIRGLFDGLSVVAFCAAIILLVRSSRLVQEKNKHAK